MKIKSGITVDESLSILSAQTKAGAFKNIIDEVYADIQNGKSLAKALGMHPKVFNTFYVSLVDVGEESGALDINLIYLASQLSKEYEFKKKVKGALMYPVIVLIAAFIVGISVSLFVLPKLIDLFKGFDVKLPLTTQLLLGFAAVMRDFGVYIGIGLIILIISLKFFVSTKALKPLWHRTLLAIPIFGKIIANSELANFTRSLGIMIRSGLPLTSALEIEINMSTNAVFHKYTITMLDSLTNGQSLSTELSTGP